ncbi:hypothetical protein BC941DRAFT_474239 [Chlamydoabsidia padenii]|nr:hypothetical protein BC941DRAFT_474239 [Chlamydoabsidia padenii]
MVLPEKKTILVTMKSVIALFFTLIIGTLAIRYGDDCQKAISAKCDNNYRVTKDCCAATQGRPIYFNELSHRCIHAFGKGINWDKFNGCCKSRGTRGNCFD